MVTRVVVCVLMVLLCLAGVSVPASAGMNFKAGVTERARYEYWRNTFDMDNALKDNRGFFRFKTSLWGKLDFDKNTSLYAKLTNENKAYTYWYQTSRKKGYHYDINEVVFDNLYLDVKDFAGLPVDLRLGRQDLLGTHGEGFLLMDGTAQDGSRTFYFNAAKATWKINQKNSLEFMYFVDNSTDDMLPIINKLDGEQALNYTDEQAFVLYHKTDAIKDTHVENYYIFKTEKGDQQRRMTAMTTKLHTLGSFVKYSFAPWAIRGQLARQFGKYGEEDRLGLGGYVFLDRSFKEKKFSPATSVGFLYLSGDDRDTTRNEAWDPLFSRWPWMSELYVLSFNSESELGYWTNLQMWRASLSLTLTPKTTLSFWYNYMRANESPAASTLLSGDGKVRGHLPQARLDYVINKNITTYLLAEYLFPGNFYRDKNDGAVFLRSEVTIKF